MSEYRAHLDFRITFANGGSLTGEGFRLDLPVGDEAPDAIELLLVRHLGLTLVEGVDLLRCEIVAEPHRGSRGVESLPAPASGVAAANGAGATQGTPPNTVVDLSHPIRAGLVTYPGLPAPKIEPFLTREDSRAKYAPGTEFAMDVMSLIGNTGTYLDSPFHRYAGGPDLSGLHLATMVDLPAEVFHLTDAWDSSRRGIGAATLADRELRGTAVLLHTGWDRHFGTAAYGTGAPFLAEDGVRFLVDAGVTLVGIDSLNIDDTESGGERPAHSLLLAAGIHVVEHLTNLASLPAHGARFTSAPPAIERFGTFPVRAFALVQA